MFCPDCKKLMMPKKANGKTVMACPVCGKNAGGKIALGGGKKQDVEVVEELETNPLTEQECPKCHHGMAYWWSKQTRAGDEPETRFFKCQKCGHTWREYK